MNNLRLLTVLRLHLIKPLARIKQFSSCKPLLAISLFALPVLYAQTLDVQRASAQDIEISVQPAIFDIPARPGDAVEQRIQVTNESNRPLPITVEVGAVLIDGEAIDGFDNKRFDVSSWVSLDETAFALPSGQSTIIPFRVTVPFSAAPGDHYAQLSIKVLGLEQTASVGEVVPQLAVPLLITVPGQITETIALTSSQLFPLQIDKQDVHVAHITFENTGTIHNLVSPQIITEKNGAIKSQTIPPFVLLPGTQRTIQAHWQPETYGSQRVYVEATYGTKQFDLKSSQERVFVTRDIHILVLLALVTWFNVYVIQNKHTVKRAVVVLVGKQG